MNNQQAFSVGYESGYYDCHHSGVKKLDLRWRQNRDEFDSVVLREQIEKLVTEYENTQPANWLDSDKHDEVKSDFVDQVFSLITGGDDGI